MVNDANGGLQASHHGELRLYAKYRDQVPKHKNQSQHGELDW